MTKHTLLRCAIAALLNLTMAGCTSTDPRQTALQAAPPATSVVASRPPTDAVAGALSPDALTTDTLPPTTGALTTASDAAGGLTSDERTGRTNLVLSPDSCIQRLQSSQTRTYPHHYALPDQLSLVSWNIYKAQGENLAQDLAQLNSQADIVLLQEALLSHELVGLKPYWRFAPGYQDGSLQSGVLTLSRWPATVHCHFVHQEPWLRTPKATNVVEYLLRDGRRLLAINLHAINFSLGLADYRRQLDDVIAIIRQHQGPVVFAGDLNSWSLRRGKLLDERLQSAGLVSADFLIDNRTRFWGQPLDHVWVRDLDISHTDVPTYTSSDHNPLLVNIDLSPLQKPAPNALAKIDPNTTQDSPELNHVTEH